MHDVALKTFQKFHVSPQALLAQYLQLKGLGKFYDVGSYGFSQPSTPDGLRND